MFQTTSCHSCFKHRVSSARLGSTLCSSASNRKETEHMQHLKFGNLTLSSATVPQLCCQCTKSYSKQVVILGFILQKHEELLSAVQIALFSWPTSGGVYWDDEVQQYSPALEEGLIEMLTLLLWKWSSTMPQQPQGRQPYGATSLFCTYKGWTSQLSITLLFLSPDSCSVTSSARSSNGQLCCQWGALHVCYCELIFLASV